MAKMSIAQVSDICDALLALPEIHDTGGRLLYQREIEGVLQRTLSVSKTASTRFDVVDLVRQCELQPGGMEALLYVFSELNPGSTAVLTARRIYAGWQLEQLLSLVPTDVLTQALIEVGSTGRAASNQDLLSSIGWEDSARWRAPALIAFADLLRAGLAGNGDQLHQWVTSTAYAVGLTADDVERLQRGTDAHWESLRSPHRVEPSHTADKESDPEMRRTITIEDVPSRTSSALIRGGVPPRNSNFTGRSEVLAELERKLTQDYQASVLPEASVHGLGGVGKTQLAVEFCYLYSDQYQLIWWIPAEDLGTVRSSLVLLADRLGLPSSPAMDQVIRSVLDALATSPLSWLLVYDNANDPGELQPLMPSANVVGKRGHVLVTTRNSAWSASGSTIEVDVFSRAESVALLGKRLPEVTAAQADRLADKLGDLPLALEQAATYILTTFASVDGYLAEFDANAARLLADGRPRQYPGTVLTIVGMALPKLREADPAAAQLLALMAHLAPEPIPMRLFWEGRNAQVTEPLRTVLQKSDDIGRAIRQIGAFGLAKIDSGNRRVEVHRLVRTILRETLPEQERADAHRDAQRLLAAANPGFPDDQSTWPRHADILPHVRAAELIHGDAQARTAVLDQIRYIYNLGDYERCRELAAEALAVWDPPGEDGVRRSTDPLTLLAIRRCADALRSLGHPDAAPMALQAYQRMLASLGEEHEYTLGAANSVGADLRRSGDITAAAALDERNLEMHRRILGAADPSTLRVMNSVAMDRRLMGDFQGAYEINVEVEQHARGLEHGALPTVLAQEAQARDLYLLGRYADAAALLDGSLPQQRRLLGADHLTVLRATCVHTAALRKVGRLTEAVDKGLSNYRNVTRRYGPDHVLAAEAGMTYANALRAAGEAKQAHKHATRSYELFSHLYGHRHPVTLCAAVNLAIVLRALNLDRDARTLNEETLRHMEEALPPTHPYILSARSGHAINLVRSHRLTEAQQLSAAILAASRQMKGRGPGHPYTLYCTVNAAVDLIETGDETQGAPLLREATAALEAMFGPEHPEVESARGQRRIECDIETVGLA